MMKYDETKNVPPSTCKIRRDNAYLHTTGNLNVSNHVMMEECHKTIEHMNERMS